MSCVFSIFRRYFSFFKYFSFFLPSGPGSRHHTHRVPSMIMVITVGQHTNTRSSLNVKGDDSNQNQTVFFFSKFFFFSFFRLWTFSFSSRVLTWPSLGSLSIVRVFTLFGVVVVVVFLLLYWPRQPEKEKKKTDYQFEIHFPLHLPRPGHKHTIMDKQKPTFFSRSFFSLLKWNWIFCYLFVYSCLNFISVCLHSIFGCWIVLWPVFRKASWN